MIIYFIKSKFMHNYLVLLLKGSVMLDKREIFKQLLMNLLPEEGSCEVGIKRVYAFRRDTPYKMKPQLNNPQIIILAQGQKNIFLGDKTYLYNTDNYYVQTVPLPVVCEALIEDGKPLLGIVLEIDPKIIGEIMYEMISEVPVESKIDGSLYNSGMTQSLLESVIRLMGTLKNENERRVLGPIYLKEILFKIITGENGEILRELAVNNSGFYQISRIINKIHENYSRTYEVRDLAREAGMSVSAFHTAFKGITSSSPLQYIKNIRLHKAKELIQQEGEKVNIAATLVGYESTSQFSREYKRFFGFSPAQDKVS